MARKFSKSFYNSQEWQQCRAYVLKRDNYLCQKCGKPAQEVHHIIHLSKDNIGDTTITLNPDNLASLCRDCHFDEHKHDKAEGRARKNAQKSEYVFDDNGYLVRREPPGCTA